MKAKIKKSAIRQNPQGYRCRSFSIYGGMASLGYSFLLVLAAFLWGTTFVAQVEGNSAGPFVFTFLRSLIAAALLLGVAPIFDKIFKISRRPKDSTERKTLWKAGIFCGIALAFGSNLQQLGIFLGTSAGKSGFLTTCYIILVPILGLFFGKKVPKKIWPCVACALAGLYLLCIHENFSLAPCDIVSFLCAFAFAAQILVVDRFVREVDNVRLSAIQFLTVSVLSAIPMAIFDLRLSAEAFKSATSVYSHASAWFPLLYAAILSSGVAFTLQIVAQNRISPTIASLLMSLESVFAVIAGAIVLGERLSSKEIVGCLCIFAAVVFAQLPGKKPSGGSAG